jgi:predicted O-methyltransferase YrrM
MNKVTAALMEAECIFSWGSSTELKWLSVMAYGAKVGIELGSWLGRSSKMLATCIQKQLYCVDTWDTSSPTMVEHIQSHGGPMAKLIEVRKPDFGWKQFCLNMDDEITNGKCVAVRADPLTAFGGEIAAPCPVDFVFVDGTHDGDRLKQLVGSYRPLIREGGLLAGRDYNKENPSVVKAVNDMFPNGQFINWPDSIWWTLV